MAADPRTLEEDDEELQEAGTSSGRRARAKAKQATLLKPDAEADPTSFDLATLEKELHTAVSEEGTRKRVDDMKKRAIKVAPSYDDFKNLVVSLSLPPRSCSCCKHKPGGQSQGLTHT